MDESSVQLKHQKQIRTAFRIVGPVLMVIGLTFLLIGMINFFMSMGSARGPRFFWCNFVGAPLLFFGGVISNLGYMSLIQRYLAGESAPVTKDTFNYMATNTTPGVKAMASAAADGWRDGSGKPGADARPDQ